MDSFDEEFQSGASLAPNSRNLHDIPSPSTLDIQGLLDSLRGASVDSDLAFSDLVSRANQHSENCQKTLESAVAEFDRADRTISVVLDVPPEEVRSSPVKLETNPKPLLMSTPTHNQSELGEITLEHLASQPLDFGTPNPSFHEHSSLNFEHYDQQNLQEDGEEQGEYDSVTPQNSSGGLLDKVVAKDQISSLLNFLVGGTESEETRTAAARAIFQLLSQNELTRSAVVQLDGIQILLNALMDDSSCATFRSYVCACFLELAKSLPVSLHMSSALEHLALLAKIDPSPDVRSLCLEALETVFASYPDSLGPFVNNTSFLDIVSDKFTKDTHEDVLRAAVKLLEVIFNSKTESSATFMTNFIHNQSWMPLVECMKLDILTASLISRALRFLVQNAPSPLSFGFKLMSHFASLSTLLKFVLDNNPVDEELLPAVDVLHAELAILIGLILAQSPASRVRLRKEMSSFPLWMASVKTALINFLASIDTEYYSDVHVIDCTGHSLSTARVSDLSKADQEFVGDVYTAQEQRIVANSTSDSTTTIDQQKEKHTQNENSILPQAFRIPEEEPRVTDPGVHARVVYLLFDSAIFHTLNPAVGQPISGPMAAQQRIKANGGSKVRGKVGSGGSGSRRSSVNSVTMPTRGKEQSQDLVFANANNNNTISETIDENGFIMTHQRVGSIPVPTPTDSSTQYGDHHHRHLPPQEFSDQQDQEGEEGDSDYPHGFDPSTQNFLSPEDALAELGGVGGSFRSTSSARKIPRNSANLQNYIPTEKGFVLRRTNAIAASIRPYEPSPTPITPQTPTGVRHQTPLSTPRSSASDRSGISSASNGKFVGVATTPSGRQKSPPPERWTRDDFRPGDMLEFSLAVDRMTLDDFSRLLSHTRKHMNHLKKEYKICPFAQRTRRNLLQHLSMHFYPPLCDSVELLYAICSCADLDKIRVNLARNMDRVYSYITEKNIQEITQQLCGEFYSLEVESFIAKKNESESKKLKEMKQKKEEEIAMYKAKLQVKAATNINTIVVKTLKKEEGGHHATASSTPSRRSVTTPAKSMLLGRVFASGGTPSSPHLVRSLSQKPLAPPPPPPPSSRAQEAQNHILQERLEEENIPPVDLDHDFKSHESQNSQPDEENTFLQPTTSESEMIPSSSPLPPPPSAVESANDHQNQQIDSSSPLPALAATTTTTATDFSETTAPHLEEPSQPEQPQQQDEEPKIVEETSSATMNTENAIVASDHDQEKPQESETIEEAQQQMPVVPTSDAQEPSEESQ